MNPYDPAVIAAKKKAFHDEVARIAQEYGDKLHTEALSFVVNKELKPGDATFIVQEADKARLLAVHQTFAALTVRFRHVLKVVGVPDSINKANELTGVAVGAQHNERNDLLNDNKKIIEQ